MRRERVLGLCSVALLFSMLISPFSVNSANSPMMQRREAGVGSIRTIAGGATVRSGSGPQNNSFHGVSGLAVNRQTGELFFSDSARNMIFRVDAQGKSVTPYAGNGIAGFNGDGKPALSTSFHVPSDVAVDSRTGDVYVADTNNYRIRAISRGGGSVRTVAGMGIKGLRPESIPTEFPAVAGIQQEIHFSGDGGPATEAELNFPSGVGLDEQGNVYIADSANARVRVVNTQSSAITVAGVQIQPQAIQTVAGTGVIGFSGDGGRALAAQLAYPKRVKVTPNGNIVVADMLNQRLRQIGRDGTITTLALGQLLGEGTNSAEENIRVFFSIDGLDVGPKGEIYYSDLKAHALFRIDPDQGGRTLLAGTGAAGRSGARELATRSQLYGVGSVAVGARGEVYLVDSWNNYIRRLENDQLTIFVGSGGVESGVPAAQANFSVIGPISVGPDGSVYVTDILVHVVRRVNPRNGRIETFAGTSVPGNTGDGGPARSAQLLSPNGIFVDREGVYLTDPQAHIIKFISARGNRITTIAGTGFFDGKFVPSGSPATSYQFGVLQGIAKHPTTGDIYIADSWSHVVQRIDRNGAVSTVAGTGRQGFSGDGGPATNAVFNWPTMVAFDRSGNLYVADLFNHRVRRISTDGRITTIAGTGRRGYNGDNKPGTEADLFYPTGLAVDAAGNIYVADSSNHRIRRIEGTPPYRITTVAGTGERGFSGDGGPATSAQLNVPRGVAFGPDGTLYITDSLNGRIRAVQMR
jgi:sugar lactone lactonase YvrE